MSSLNLGNIDADALLVFGGPYGNLEATQALLAKAKSLGISTQHMICTGDLAAYCADPAATTNLLRSHKIHTIQGNCEQALAQSENDCGCGFEAGSTCETLSQSWFPYCQAQMTPDTLSWFQQLPQHICFEFGGKRFLVVHGSPKNISSFVFESKLQQTLRNEIQDMQVDCIIAGHSGLPFTQISEELCWHNAGVIGMPANDGTARVWYSIIRKTDTAITFEHCALHYSAAIAQNKMHQAQLPKEYSEALSSGRWPSLDILPAHEAARTGVPLHEHNVQWQR